MGVLSEAVGAEAAGVVEGSARVATGAARAGSEAGRAEPPTGRELFEAARAAGVEADRAAVEAFAAALRLAVGAAARALLAEVGVAGAARVALVGVAAAAAVGAGGRFPLVEGDVRGARVVGPQHRPQQDEGVAEAAGREGPLDGSGGVAGADPPVADVGVGHVGLPRGGVRLQIQDGAVHPTAKSAMLTSKPM